ncbi:hypothetical protein IT413_05515 [Candidatus Peregrinibacteria bacterium]|nr:hypothetical protein [Candidatus Peregrinibacteria bacterium]
MARPTSKYFTPVIKKILEAKKAENIVVDQEFKNVLRAQMLSKISAAPVRKEVVREKHDVLPERTGFDFAEFFNKFRYPLAIVPSMFLLVIVAMSAMKLPVSIPSEVIVPTSTPVQNQNDAVEDSISGSISNESGGAQKLKTFSGSSVLPSNYRNGGKTTSPAVISNPQSSNLDFDFPENSSNQIQQTVPVQKAAPVTQPSAQQIEPSANPFNFVLQSLLEPQQEESFENNANNTEDVEDQSVNFQAVPVQPSVPAVSASQNSLQTQPEIQAVKISPEVADMNLEQNTQPSANDALKVQLNSDQPLDLQLDQNKTLLAEPLTTSTTQNLQMDATLLDTQDTVLRAPVESLVLEPQYTFYYSAYISDADKAAFEAEALAAVDSSNVTFLNVSSGTDRDVVEVSYTFTDGTTTTKLFKKLDGEWHLAKYVQRYFYDNGLQYQVAE